ncbi:MAG: AAA family ATPase [Thermodesulfovibrionales bacterium]
MAKIIHLDIKNYRGIKHLPLEFKADQNLICFIGRGDSGKTTILDAISSALSPSWNLNFYDTDFYNCDYNKNIEIVVSLINVPEKFLSENKFGLYVRGLNRQNNTIIDDVTLEELNEDLIPVLTVKFTVDSSLEPQWVVTNKREQEDKPISGDDRARLNCYRISDYVDRHFSWNKGNPLYALLKLTNSDETLDNDNIIMQYLREAKEEISKNNFENLIKVTDLIKLQAAELGLDISNTSTTLDSRELSIKDGRISLHEDSVPFRLKGKGSKRLASIAIQSVLVRNGGIMLIDEVEQGLEPDRVKQAVRSLNRHHAGQIFITTHSRDAITELGSEPLRFLLKDKKTDIIETRSFDINNEYLQKTIRACPEAFFAKKVIVCEGATEVGICRAMDKWRRTNTKQQMSLKDCAYVDGTGNTIVQRVDEINAVGLKTALFCDSDLPEINARKSQWKTDGVSIFDCDDSLCLEQQVFKDLLWNGVKALLQYAKDKNGDSFTTAFADYISIPLEEWADTEELRNKIISEFKIKDDGSSGKKWFKTIHHGEALGDIVLRHLDEIDEKTRLKSMLTGLSEWIDA